MPAYTITLTGLAALGFHGVLPEERRKGQPFLVDVALEVVRPASDDLATTVNYAALAQALVADVTGDPVDLIETLADRLAATCLSRAGVRAVTVTVHKPEAPVGVRFSDVTVTVHRRAPVEWVLSLGSNVGDSLDTLRRAVARLAGLAGVTVTAVSPVYRTVPVGGVTQEDFLNLVVLAEVRDLGAPELLGRTQAIEAGLGRVRDVRWGPRTLDIDLISAGDVEVCTPGLVVPHPRAHERPFVLVPWLAVDPDATLPGHGRVADLVAGMDAGGVRRLDDATVEAP